jgi:hypothetical protein
MPREEIVAAIDGHQDEFATNFWGSFDRLRTQANEKVRQAPTRRLVELIRAAVTGGAFYGTFAAATLTSAQLDSVLDQVLARNGQATIIGSAMALRYMSAVGLEYSNEAKDQILRTGAWASTRARASCRSRTSRTSPATSCCPTTSSGSSAARPAA